MLSTFLLSPFFQSAYAGAEQLKLKPFACTSAKAGRLVTTLSSRSYIDSVTGQSNEIPVINAWIEGLESNKLFTDVRFTSKNNKFYARAKFFERRATVSIEPNKNLVIIRYNGKDFKYEDSFCLAMTAE